MDNRFANIFANFNAIQSANEQLAEAEKYRGWQYMKKGRGNMSTNCLQSPDGRQIRHGHNGQACNCDVSFKFMIGDGSYNGVAHTYVTR